MFIKCQKLNVRHRAASRKQQRTERDTAAILVLFIDGECAEPLTLMARGH
jgi:hypothetical protein